MGMLSRLRRTFASGEAGFALIEVLISGVVLVTASAGVAAALKTSVHSAAEQRGRSQSYAIAQEDQARMRGMRIPTLKTLSTTAGQVRTIPVDGITYTVTSHARYVNDTSSVPSCGTTADYFETTSEVIWGGKNVETDPTVIRSIVAPPTEALKPKAGNLSVFVKNGSGVGVSAIGVSGSGPTPFSGSTDTTGCALFTELTEGNYSVSITGTNLVEKDGNAPTPKVVTVNPEGTTTLELQYAAKGEVPIEFKTINYANVSEFASAEKLIVSHSEMTTAKQYGTNGTLLTDESPLTPTILPTYTVAPVFPFGTPVSFYTGSCAGAIPGEKNTPTAGPALLSYTVPSGLSPVQTITMPSLLLNVQVNGVATNGVKVKVTDSECSTNKNPREYTTETVSTVNGRLKEPELPWSKYEVCAWTTISGVGKRKITEIFPVNGKVEKTFNILSSTPTTGEC